MHNKLFLPITPLDTAKCRVFCLPFAGGSAEIYYSWQRYFSSDIQLCPIQMPGRSYRMKEAPYTKMRTLIDDLLQVLKVYFNKPFALFGHSLGALIAFEFARHLPLLYQTKLRCFFASGRYAPQANYQAKKIHHLSDDDFLMEVMKLDATPIELLKNKDFIKLILPMLKADFQLSETYIYNQMPKLNCPIIGFAGTRDTLLPVEAMQSWELETRNTYNLYRFEGGHFFINEFKNQLCEIIKEKIFSE